MTIAYQLRNITFGYGDSDVLRVDRLDIPKGEIVGLAGPNGSGKTTLLHLLAFVEQPLNGTIRFFDETACGDNILSFRRRVGLLLQNPYLFHSTVLANLTWGLKIRGISSKEAGRRALDALETVGLSGFEHRFARSLSGGETQRVALARSLVLDPEVLLLDEPANHMDKDSIRRTEDIVLNLNRNLEKTVIMTTHNLSSVQNLAHRVLHMVSGNVVEAAPDNLFKGVVIDDGRTFQTENIAIRLPFCSKSGTHLTIDPEKIVLFPEKPGEPMPNTFHGVIDLMILESGKIKIRVSAGEKFLVAVDSGNPVAEQINIGREVFVQFADGITVF